MQMDGKFVNKHEQRNKVFFKGMNIFCNQMYDRLF